MPQLSVGNPEKVKKVVIKVILVKDKATKEDGIKLHYDCENTDIFSRIILDPNMGDYTFEMLRNLLVNEYGFTSLEKGGKTYNRVLRSQLYAKQPQAILKID